jgi:hypothetical protein
MWHTHRDLWGWLEWGLQVAPWFNIEFVGLPDKLYSEIKGS